jgi:hypothetical protein
MLVLFVMPFWQSETSEKSKKMSKKNEKMNEKNEKKQETNKILNKSGLFAIISESDTVFRSVVSLVQGRVVF